MVTEAKQWISINKLLVFFILTTVCLFVSTDTITLQRKSKCEATLDNEMSRKVLNGKMISNNDKDINFRLPRHIVPKNYGLYLIPYRSNKTFNGTVVITLQVLEPTKIISLHSNNLIIREVTLEDTNNLSIPIQYKNTTLDKRELLNIYLQYKINKDFYKLHIKFSGTLDKKIVGFYASTLKNGGFIPKFIRKQLLITGYLFYFRLKNYSGPVPYINLMENMRVNMKLSERLSQLIRPVNYKLELRPDINTGAFQGNVKIQVAVKQNNNCISLHSNFLNISDVKVYKGGDEVAVSKFLEVKQIEQLCIYFDHSLVAGDYNIQIKFNGDLTRNIVGLYLSRLTDNRTMVASKFQPTYARQAFPCFDEPDFKATYDITLWKPTSYVALSNMNEISRSFDESANMDKVTFATSVPMSTYLACFVVCDFDHKETDINSGGIGRNFKLRSFAQKNELHKIDFAQDIGKRATEFYIKYYEVPFPLPKLDMIAIPDYVSGATEHWGLITYRETSFLVDEAKASASNKLAVANTIAHELAHMWFGNLVTMKWWDEVWLNEGFATYMQVKALNAIEPTWAMLDHFVIKTLHHALRIDAKLSSHPIVQTVATPDQITAIFDSISYNKGASILRMLEGFTGEENFRRGVSDYLKKFEFGNTITQDLLTSLEPYFKRDHPDLDISYIMDTWTRQMGYPLLTVKSGDEPNTYVVTQSRFLLDPEAVYPNDSKFNYRWFVPITYKTNNGVYQNILWFSDTEKDVKISLKGEDKWLKLNHNNVGYYRVNYSLDMWHKLIEQLKTKSEQLKVSDRCNLLNDVFALAEARAVPYELALNLTTYLAIEESYEPWTSAQQIFDELEEKLLNTVAYDHLRKYVQRLISPLYQKQNWDTDNLGIVESLLRTRVLRLAVRYGVPEAVQKVRSMFVGWLRTHGTPENVPIKQDLRDIVYYYGMKTASQEEWEQLWEIYLKEDDAQEKLKLRNALAAPRDINILEKYLELAWDESKVRSQDYLTVVQQIASNDVGTAIAWDLTRKQWPQLVLRFTLNSRYLGNLLPAITATFNTDRKLREMETFFEQYPEAGAGEAGRQRALENVRNNIKWTTNNQQSVANWLRDNHEF